MENNKIKIKEQFQSSIHLWGRITIGIALLFTFTIPFYLTFILGYYPNSSHIVSGLISVVGFVGVIWFVEPVSYFTTLGSAGTYMSFLSGNIGNMRLPVIIATQEALELEPGSDESEVAGIFAIISSTVTNLVILAIVLAVGQNIVKVLPAEVLSAFNFALPGILGAMLVMMGSKLGKSQLVSLVAIAVGAMVFIQFSPRFLPAGVAQLIGSADVGLVAILGIVFSLLMAKKDNGKASN